MLKSLNNAAQAANLLVSSLDEAFAEIEALPSRHADGDKVVGAMILALIEEAMASCKRMNQIL